MYVCLFYIYVIMVTFKMLDVESSFWSAGITCTGYGSSSCMKVIGSRSNSQQQKTRIPYIPAM